MPVRTCLFDFQTSAEQSSNASPMLGVSNTLDHNIRLKSKTVRVVVGV